MSGHSRAWAAALAGVVVGVTIVTVPTATQAAPTTQRVGEGRPFPGHRPRRAGRRAVGRPAAPCGRLRRSTREAHHGPRRPRAGCWSSSRPQAGVDRAAFRRSAEAAGLVVRDVDAARGTLEGFVALDDVQALEGGPRTGHARRRRSGRGRASAPPRRRASRCSGSTRSRSAGSTARGVTIGALSDSYDTATTTVDGRAAHRARRAGHRQRRPARRRATRRTRRRSSCSTTPAPAAPTRAAPCCRSRTTSPRRPSSASPRRSAGRGRLRRTTSARLADPRRLRGGRDRRRRRLLRRADVLRRHHQPTRSTTSPAQGVHYFTSAGNDGSTRRGTPRSRLVSAVEGAGQGTNLDLSRRRPGPVRRRLPGPAERVRRSTSPRTWSSVRRAAACSTCSGTTRSTSTAPTLGAPFFTGTGDDHRRRAGADASPSPRRPTRSGQTVQFRTDAIPSGTTDLVLTVDRPRTARELGTHRHRLVARRCWPTRLTQAGHVHGRRSSGFDGDTGDFTVDVCPVLSAVGGHHRPQPAALRQDGHVPRRRPPT